MPCIRRVLEYSLDFSDDLIVIASIESILVEAFLEQLSQILR